MQQEDRNPSIRSARDSGLPVVLVPGGITPAEISYAALAQEIRDEASLVLKDLELYAGDSPPPHYSLDLEAEGVGRAADEAGFETFHLVGYSAGGAVCLAFTATHPERVRSLALIEPDLIGSEGRTPEEMEEWEEMNRIAALPPEERMEALMGPSNSPPGPQPPWMAKRPAGFEAMIRALGRYHGKLEDLRRFRGPVYLAIAGLSKPVEWRKAERLGAVLPDMEVEVYEGRTHFDAPHRAEAGRFAHALRRLWERAEQAAPAP
jgi:pimeloyl-ACP methyl ester carboxylesterase